METNKFAGSLEIQFKKANANPFSSSNQITLQDISFSHNKLSKVIFMSEMYLLQKLNISDNQLLGLSNLSNVKYLSHLNISSNNLSTLNSEFAALQKLQYLDASHNSITQLEIGRMRSLKHLLLTNNKIENIDFLNGNGLLEYVDLSDNQIEKIPELYGLVSLKQLFLK